MKLSAKFIAICLLSAAVLSGLSLLTAFATDNSITDQQIERIRTNCISAKNTLSQLHSSDALLRVNRGQIYESMSTKLMSRFNSRVSNNGYKNDGLVSAAASYESALDAFRSDYIAYEEQLSLAIEMDCSKQPVAFYDAVALARNQRNQLNADIVRLNKQIDQYYSAVEQFEKDYQAAVNGVVSNE